MTSLVGANTMSKFVYIGSGLAAEREECQVKYPIVAIVWLMVQKMFSIHLIDRESVVRFCG